MKIRPLADRVVIKNIEAWPPHVMGPEAHVEHSMITGGCEVHGSVERSVLFHSVVVEEGAVVRYSILMPGTRVKAGAVVEYAIVAENALICEGARVGAPPEGDGGKGIAVVAQNLRVGAGAAVPASAMITEDVKGGDAL